MIHLVENLDLILKSSSANKFTFKGASSSHKQAEQTLPPAMESVARLTGMVSIRL